METKNLKSIEWRCNKWDSVPNVRIRITTAEVLRPRVFVVYNCLAVAEWTFITIGLNWKVVALIAPSSTYLNILPKYVVANLPNLPRQW